MGLAAIAIIAAGCGDGTDVDPSPTAAPATTAASPATSADPAADDTSSPETVGEPTSPAPEERAPEPADTTEPADTPEPADTAEPAEPADTPEPDPPGSGDEPIASAGSGTLELAFETAWGTNRMVDPLGAGNVRHLTLDGSAEPVDGLAVLAGRSSSEEELALLPPTGGQASIAILAPGGDGSLRGMILVLDMQRLAAGERLVIGEDLIAGGVWRVPPGASQPGSLSPFTEGVLALSVGGTGAGDPIVGTFSGVFNDAMARQP